MRIPVAIYPYCAELLPIVKYFETLQKEYTISKLISPPGLGLGGKVLHMLVTTPIWV